MLDFWIALSLLVSPLTFEWFVVGLSALGAVFTTTLIFGFVLEYWAWWVWLLVFGPPPVIVFVGTSDVDPRHYRAFVVGLVLSWIGSIILGPGFLIFVPTTALAYLAGRRRRVRRPTGPDARVAIADLREERFSGPGPGATSSIGSLVVGLLIVVAWAVAATIVAVGVSLVSLQLPLGDTGKSRRARGCRRVPRHPRRRPDLDPPFDRSAPSNAVVPPREDGTRTGCPGAGS